MNQNKEAGGKRYGTITLNSDFRRLFFRNFIEYHNTIIISSLRQQNKCVLQIKSLKSKTDCYFGYRFLYDTE
ncbi:hypothetical protein AR437_06535 [Christensenella hongkongensis]|uniref:Uncharacterized protein n=1 Tax=Christensenella hongkongensis TaxID=270498 RepID=A0A0M2NKZ9_9FIRM|nr:hypothetical protein CHK_0802 [Christensenella hongkongensis]KUJ29778.1 hypothetical protein AR437_06535 [Christensenella hongkongensis]